MVGPGVRGHFPPHIQFYCVKNPYMETMECQLARQARDSATGLVADGSHASRCRDVVIEIMMNKHQLGSYLVLKLRCPRPSVAVREVEVTA